MAKDFHLGSFKAENIGRFLTGFLAEEDRFDRRSLWRLGSWSLAAVGAVIVALLAHQSSVGSRRDQVAAADLARQSQQIQSVAKESQNEARRLASAIDTLNSDRDRLYSRVTVLEHGLVSVTGAVARQNAAPASPQAIPPSAAPAAPHSASQDPAPAPIVAPVATTAAVTPAKPKPDAKPPEPGPATVASVGPKTSTSNTPPAPATPPMPSKSVTVSSDTAVGKPIEAEAPEKTIAAAPVPVAASPVPEVVASIAPADHQEPDAVPSNSPKLAVKRTEFGVDVGGANSIAGLRALWLGLLKWRSNAALTTLHPIIVLKESSTGLGMQLRLVAGPLNDAAAAAKICAGMIENERPCETTLFEGQRLALKADDAPAATDPASVKPAAAKPALAKPASAKPAAHRRIVPERVEVQEPPKPEPPTLWSFISRTIAPAQ